LTLSAARLITDVLTLYNPAYQERMSLEKAHPLRKDLFANPCRQMVV